MGKPTLVLDLDETLVSFINDSQHEGRSFFHFRGEFVENFYYIKRPGLDEFLKAMAELYTIVVYTASLAGIAELVLGRFDPQGTLISRVYSRGFTEQDQHYVRTKCLTKVKKKNLKRVIWLDDSPVYPADQQKYGIQTRAFEVCKKDEEGKFITVGRNYVMDYDYENDKVLWELTPFLTALAKLDDFEAAIAAYKQGRCDVIDGQLVIDGRVVDQMVVDSDQGDDSDEFEDDDRVLRKMEEEKRAREAEEQRKKKEAEEAAEEEAKRKLLIPDPEGPFWKFFINTLPDEEMNETQKRAAHLYISTKFLDAEADCVFLRLAIKGCLVDSVKRFGCSVNKLSPYEALDCTFNELYGPPHSPQIRAVLLSILKKAAIKYFHYGKVLIFRTALESDDIGIDLMETTIADLNDQFVCFWEPIPMTATLNFLKDNHLLTVPDWFQSFDQRRWWPRYVSSDFERFWNQSLEERGRTMRQLEKLCSMDSKIVPGKETEIYDAYEAKDPNEFGLRDFLESRVEESRCKFYVEKDMVLFRLQFEDGTVVKCGILAMPQNHRRGVDELLKSAATMCNNSTDEFFLCFDFWEWSRTFAINGVRVVVLHLDRSSVFSKEHLEVADFEVETEAETRKMQDYMRRLRSAEYADRFDFTPRELERLRL